MLIDDVTITVRSGNGGNGRVDFNRTKMSLGPTGGRGGKGGDVYLRAVSDIGALSRFRNQKRFFAENGQMGGIQTKEGKSGETLILTVPIGTQVIFEESQKKEDMDYVGKEVLIAMGGQGGRGNFLFRSSTNTTPKQSEVGKEGVEVALHLLLKLIADVGFIGLPNAGKSSLLNVLTNAKSRVANYAFTTLEPNLGAYYDLILADIPGLIEGASEGKGLGIKFLQHIERTGVLFHLISVENGDPVKNYRIVREELGKYKAELLEKREYVLLSKCDVMAQEEWEEKKRQLEKVGVTVVPFSSETGEGLSAVKKILIEVGKQKSRKKEEDVSNVSVVE